MSCKISPANIRIAIIKSCGIYVCKNIPRYRSRTHKIRLSQGLEWCVKDRDLVVILDHKTKQSKTTPLNPNFDVMLMESGESGRISVGKGRENY